MNLWEVAISIYVLSIVFVGTSTAMVDAVHWRAAEVYTAEAVACGNRAAEQWLRGLDPTGKSTEGCVVRVEAESEGWTRVLVEQGGHEQTLWLESHIQG